MRGLALSLILSSVCYGQTIEVQPVSGEKIEVGVEVRLSVSGLQQGMSTIWHSGQIEGDQLRGKGSERIFLGTSPGLRTFVVQIPSTGVDHLVICQFQYEKSSSSKWMLLELEMIKLTNEERVKRGRKTLEIGESLMKTSRAHADWMASKQRHIHSSYGVAENIAMGDGNPQAVVRGWMNSSGHRANMLNSRHKKIGVAGYRASSGRIYWCQQFSR